MQVKKINNNAYKKLIMYAYEICDKVELKKIKHFVVNKEKKQEILKIIISNPKFTKKNLIKNYSEKTLDDIYFEYKDDNRFFCDNEIRKKLHYKNDVEYQNVLTKYKKSYINSIIELFLYNERCIKFLEKYENNIIDKISTEYEEYYYFKMDKQFINFFMNETDNIYDFTFPYNLENLCIYINDDIWLESVVDDKLCFINCRSEEEYEKLKSFGIDFAKEKYEKELI